ncbi:high-affinity branched-chain amino acid transporter, ATP-binding protein [Campylobacter lari]|uniref:High-affinity branched-chain amino acid transporter, ATP-binding protein n=1 Tax=Campylobacter lari TaxID=201 RepID=A0A5L4XNQ6_CAMLA|nr:high-affinity branched-chain amino acid transporter, ATP-binding protein [Campylobacter lari]AJC89475.1 high-affinity branched-chain amino acid transporter, ATP-binding protein [Campylobacter lari subsp. concheus LMG 11760]EAH7031360.1 high-affinity branched-chain amino acid transporter, ATP-binding protein [Campylobacter lari]EAH7581183.1 high-affinity branched-chain amino acid transporter, ATP-binding protein [Campylobacter lari]EAH7586118.1 high-affinity branched-chain amino acid transpor
MLVVKDLHVYYGLIEAVKGIDFTIKTGSIVSLIGSNGAGKTSTLNAMLNCVKKTGEVTFLGYDTQRHLPYTLVQKGIALVPEGRRVFINLTIEENLKIGAFNNAENYEHLKNQMYRLFPRLKDKKNALAGTLSGGEAQMLAISRALMSEPKLLMLDEPSLGLAPKIVGEVFDIIVKLKEEGITILLVEQNAFSALKISDYAYVLENGKIAMHAPAKDLIGNDEIRKKYLGA